VIRLWNRVGTFRVLSVAVLLSGAVGAAAMAANRQTQHPLNKSADTVTMSDADEARTIQDLTAERERAAAAGRSAQREAQAKADAAAAAAAAQAKAAGDAAKSAAGPTKPGTPAKPPALPPAPPDCNAYTGNPAVGCTLLLQAGFPISQMGCLYNLWMHESHWNVSSANSSGAFGIPQALPGIKMAAYGADWRTNPATQIKWGLGYIKGRYGNPCGGWSHFQQYNWY
jgi:hypothetical protein